MVAAIDARKFTTADIVDVKVIDAVLVTPNASLKNGINISEAGTVMPPNAFWTIGVRLNVAELVIPARPCLMAGTREMLAAAVAKKLRTPLTTEVNTIEAAAVTPNAWLTTGVRLIAPIGVILNAVFIVDVKARFNVCSIPTNVLTTGAKAAEAIMEATKFNTPVTAGIKRIAGVAEAKSP